MKKIVLLAGFVLALVGGVVNAAEFGCLGGGAVSGTAGYALGKAVSPEAGTVLAVIGAVVGCKGGSKIEDGTYGKPAPEKVYVPVLSEVSRCDEFADSPEEYATCLRYAARKADREQREEQRRRNQYAACVGDSKACSGSVWSQYHSNRFGGGSTTFQAGQPTQKIIYVQH